MLILAFESSAKAASVALARDGVLLGESFLASGKTHSVTLLPLAERMLGDCAVTVNDLDAIAVSKGPGSFTGVRIGVSAAKGLAWGAEKPCIGVSTLEAMAWQLSHVDGVLCPVMDARRSQVYNALFAAKDGTITRITPDRAISLKELQDSLSLEKGPKFLVGDGSKLCYNTLSPSIPTLRFPPMGLELQRASGVVLAAQAALERGDSADARTLVPNYLRLSQAERERLQKSGG